MVIRVCARLFTGRPLEWDCKICSKMVDNHLVIEPEVSGYPLPDKYILKNSSGGVVASVNRVDGGRCLY